MKLVLEVSGDDSVIGTGLDYFVRQNGWNESEEMTKIKFAETILKKFMRENIQTYAMKVAREQAAMVASEQITAALDTATTILSEE